MNPETIAAVVGGVAGGVIGGVLGIAGALLGVAWERALQRRGKVYTRIIFTHPTFVGKYKAEYGSIGAEGRNIYAATREQFDKMLERYLSYNFRLGFYNEKDIDTGLTDIHGAIIAPDGSDFIELRSDVYGGDKVISLTSRQWVYFNLISEEEIGEDRFEEAKRCDRIQVRGKWPNGRPFKSDYLTYNIKTYFQGDDPDAYMEQK